MDKQQLFLMYQKYRLIIFPVTTAIAGVILIAFVIVPQLSKLMNNNAAYTDIQEKNSFLEVKAEELEVIDGEKLKQKLDVSLLALPSNKDLTDVIGILQNVVTQSGFGISTLQFGADTAISGQQAFKVKLEISGPKAIFSNLLTNIEGSYRPMKIDSIDITSSRDSEQVNGTLNINVFYAPIPNSLGGVETPLPKLSEKDEEVIASLSRVTSSTPAVATNLPARGKTNPFE